MGNGHRPGDPRSHRRYTEFALAMKATLPPVCWRCGEHISNLPYPHPYSWSWDHVPSVAQIMATLPPDQWLDAACDPNGGLPAHRLCNNKGQAATPPLPSAPEPKPRHGWYCDRPECLDNHSPLGFKPDGNGGYIGLHWEPRQPLVK